MPNLNPIDLNKNYTGRQVVEILDKNFSKLKENNERQKKRINDFLEFLDSVDLTEEFIRWDQERNAK